MITSQKTTDPNAFPITNEDLVWGSFPLTSYVRPMYMYSGNEDQFEIKGAVKEEMLARIIATVRDRLGKD